jgi:hypothetical protein
MDNVRRPPSAPASSGSVGARRHGLGRRPRGRTRGQSTVEFALIALPFFAIFFAMVDYAQIYFYKNALQNALRETARFASAGDIIPMTNSAGEVFETNNGVSVPEAIKDSSGREASRYGCLRMWFQSNCVINMATNQITVVSASSLPGAPPILTTNSTTGEVQLLSGSGTNSSGAVTNAPAVAGPGNASDYIQVTATYTLHTITPIFSFLNGYSRQGMNTYPVTVTAIVKNEPALLNFEHTNMYSNESP